MPNFLAVDFYQNGAKGGAFKAVQWLNKQWKGEENKGKQREIYCMNNDRLLCFLYVILSEQIKQEERSNKMSLFDAMELMETTPIL